MAKAGNRWRGYGAGRALLVSLLALLFALVVAPVPAGAAPASSQVTERVDPDGSAVDVVVHGDAFFSYVTTPEGLLVQEDPETGATSYVVRTEDETLGLGPAVADEEAPEDACGQEDLFSDEARRAYKALAGIDWEPADDTGFDLVEVEDVASSDEVVAVSASGATVPQDAKTLPVLTIVVEFQNMPASTEYNWSETLFGKGDTLQTYYLDMSQEAFAPVPAQETYASDTWRDVADDGVVHVTLPLDHGTWMAEDSGTEEDKAMLRALASAVRAADPYVDFSSYDTNGNGTIDTNELVLCFVVAGYEAAGGTSSQPELSLWSHAWKLGARGLKAPQVDGVSVSPYVAISERYLRDGEETQNPWGVLCHEMGHYLGLPDLYPTKREFGTWMGYDVGYLSLMAYSEWSQLYGSKTPGALDAWSRYRLGWIQPTVIDVSDLTKEGSDYVVPSQLSASGYQALLLRLSDTEYFLIENRQDEGYDEGLAREYPLGPSGVVIWHVDESALAEYEADNTVNDTDHRPAVMPVFAEYEDDVLCVDSGGQWPDVSIALWSRSLWESVAEGVGDRLFFLTYGGSDTPQGRAASNVWIQFVSDPARDMTVRLGVVEPDNPDSPDDSPDGPDDSPDEPEDDPTTPDEPDDETDKATDDEGDHDGQDTPDQGEADSDGTSDMPGGDDAKPGDDSQGTWQDREEPHITPPVRVAPAAARLPQVGERPLPLRAIGLAGLACLTVGALIATWGSSPDRNHNRRR